MARRSYSEADKALVFAELEITDGNIKRTARNLNIPISTVRYFRDQWREQGLPKEIAEALPAVVGEFVADAERIRDKLLVALEVALDRGEMKPREMVTALGVLTDKIRAAKGLDTKRVEHTLNLPDAEQMRALFAGVIGEVVGAAEQRNDELLATDIVDGTWEPAETKALPLTTQSTEA